MIILRVYLFAKSCTQSLLYNLQIVADANVQYMPFYREMLSLSLKFPSLATYKKGRWLRQGGGSCLCCQCLPQPVGDSPRQGHPAPSAGTSDGSRWGKCVPWHVCFLFSSHITSIKLMSTYWKKLIQRTFKLITQVQLKGLVDRIRSKNSWDCNSVYSTTNSVLCTSSGLPRDGGALPARVCGQCRGADDGWDRWHLVPPLPLRGHQASDTRVS